MDSEHREGAVLFRLVRGREKVLGQEGVAASLSLSLSLLTSRRLSQWRENWILAESFIHKIKLSDTVSVYRSLSTCTHTQTALSWCCDTEPAIQPTRFYSPYVTPYFKLYLSRLKIPLCNPSLWVQGVYWSAALLNNTKKHINVADGDSL